MLTQKNSFLLVVDLQERLMPLIYQKEELLKNTITMIKSAQILGIPIFWTEHAPDKIGRTISPLREALKGVNPISKITFSCCADPKFMKKVSLQKRRQALICGIETHICVYQTARDFARLKYGAHVVADAVSSRTEQNKSIGLERIRESKANITSTETAVCELLCKAEGEKFKQVIELIK